MRILVTYGSKMGGTAGLADMVATALRERGHESIVRRAERMYDLDGFEAIVIGGALYSGHWHRDAVKFIKHHAGILKTRPVYLFSSGPLDDTATEEEIPPTTQVDKAMEMVDAKGHVTFGGRMPVDATGFLAKSMAKKNSGDWRDEDQVIEWVNWLDGELTGGSAAKPVDVEHRGSAG